MHSTDKCERAQGTRCVSCPKSLILLIPVGLAAVFGIGAVVYMIWKVSAVQMTGVDAEAANRDDVETAKDAATAAAKVGQSAARISNTAIVSSIAFPAMFQISITFEMPFGFPSALVQFAEWVTSIVSLDLGQVGSPECAMDDDPEMALTSKFLMTVRILPPTIEATHEPTPSAAVQHVGFLAICAFLTVPQLSKGCRSTEHRTLHSMNARTAFYTMAVGALIKSCAKMIDCTWLEVDGTYRLDSLPDTVCLHGFHRTMATLGVLGLVFYCVVVPYMLYLPLKRCAADGYWTQQELESHAWLILKVRKQKL